MGSNNIENLNNLYNFKNPIRHFIDISQFWFSSEGICDIKNLSWTQPFSFRVKKQDDKYRTLRIPNVLNFIASYYQFKDLPHFEKVQNLDPLHKRLTGNLVTGDFLSGEYDFQLQRDFEKLCVFDCLLRLDIKEFYGRIYTHHLKISSHAEQFLRNLNSGISSGLIMGNYLSLYFAEAKLSEIAEEINEQIITKKLNCEFSYFSDDFYFFHNKSDESKIIELFDTVLENHSLERNELEKESWDYESYNNYNLVERYWKKIIVFCLEKVGKRVISKKLTFINQIIYRMSCLKDNRHKKALINNFFKTYYFRNLRLNEYKVSPYDYHQLCFLFKYSPEVLLYCIDKFDEMSLFDKNKVKRFFEVRYEESLKAKFNEEQLYFYYAIKILDFEDILDKTKELVSISKNQVLISYYLMDNIFRTEEIEKLKAQKDEKYWFQSYHLILFNKELNNKLIDSIEDYLIPKEAKKDKQRKFYTEFYEANISAGRTIIRNIEKVKQEVIRYLNLKVAESKKRYKQKS